MLELFPYKIKLWQIDMVNDIERAIADKHHFVFEAATGSGKTVSVLVPALAFAMKNKKKVLYLTRTNSQQIQVIKESRKIREKLEFKALAIQGRVNFCLLAIKGELKESTAEELSLVCEKLKKDVLKKRDRNACPYYFNFLELEENPLYDFTFKEMPTAEEFVEKSRRIGVCPYESMKSLLPFVDLVIAPYPYFFDIDIRTKLLEWMEISAEELILIIDEAHNLPDFAREERSVRLTERSIDRIESEVREFGEFIYMGIKTSDFAETIRDTMNTLAKHVFGKERDEVLIIGSEFEDLLAEYLKVNKTTLRNYLKELKKFGEKIRMKRLELNKLPRSYIHSVSWFIAEWMDLNEEDLIKIFSREDVLKLEISSLDPSVIASAVEDCYVSIHMSGTLRPFEEYVASVFRNIKPETKYYLSPFPKENLKLEYLEDVTTKYEIMEKNNEEITKIHQYLNKILSSTDRNCVIFFPSYRVLEKILNLGLFLKKRVYVDRKEMKQREFVKMVNSFKKGGGVFISVIGSRFSEGLDFPEGELELAVIVGIPYPKPTVKQKALEYYYSRKFGAKFGYFYTVTAPTARRMRQAIGRMIRSEKDRGFAVIMDKRIKYFKDYIKAEKSENIEKEILEFFEV